MHCPTGTVRPPEPRPVSLSQAQLEMVVTIASDAIIAVDERQRIVFFNDGAEAIFGYRREEIVGEPLARLLPARFHDAHARHIRVFASGPEHARRMGERRDIAGLRKDGTEFPAEASIARAADRAGQTFLVVLRDVTDQRRAREALLDSQRRLAEAQHIAHIGSWEWRAAEDRVDWSDELYRIHGLEPGSVELTFAAFLDHVVAEDRENTAASLQRALDSGEPFDFEHRILRADGAARLLRCWGTAAAGGAGRPARVLGVCHDITQQRAAEKAALELVRESAARAAAQAAEARMTFLAAASQELASSLDYETTLQTVAQLAVPALADWAAVDILEGGVLRRLAVAHSDPEKVAMAHEISRRYPPDPDAPHGAYRVVRSGQTEFVPEIPDSLIEEVARDEDHLRLIRGLGLRSYLGVPLATHQRVHGVIVLVHAESNRRYTDEDRRIAEDLGRRAATAIESAQLVTQLRDAQEKLQEQAQELELGTEELEQQNLALQQQAAELKRLNSAKSDFMATVSHELRTPLNAIIGYSELLRDGVPVSVPDEALKHVERIQLGARHLLQLIEEILTFSSLEAGQQRARIEDVDIDGLLVELEAILEPLAGQQGLDFMVRRRSVPPRIRTDPTKLRQILLNLLANAVKFTEQGSVELEVDSDDGVLTFTVRDTGIGVAPADEPLLFEPFWQADQSHTRRVQGAGLGLAIAKRFAHLLEGTITVRSQPAGGSEFTLRLPHAPARRPAE
jgi:PAS domain S-box-containing protein